MLNVNFVGGAHPARRYGETQPRQAFLRICNPQTKKARPLLKRICNPPQASFSPCCRRRHPLFRRFPESRRPPGFRYR